MSEQNGIKYVNFNGRAGPFSITRSIKLRNDQVVFLQKEWDKETYGEFSSFLRYLIDSISEKKLDLDRLMQDIGYQKIEINSR